MLNFSKFLAPAILALAFAFMPISCSSSSSTEGEEQQLSSSSANSSSSLEVELSSSSSFDEGDPQPQSSSSSFEAANSSSSEENSPVQATTCENFVGNFPLSNAPANPYTACFKYDNKCYTCKIASESEEYTCETGWVWTYPGTNNSNINENLDNGHWYNEVACPAASSSSSAAQSSSSLLAQSSSAITPSSSACAKAIALTFDDGPTTSNGGTTALLATLADKKVKATFFVIGSNIRSTSGLAKAIYDGGHELANHSDGYANLIANMSKAQVQTSLESCSAEIKKITGSNPTMFRAPEFAKNTNVEQVTAALGLPIIHSNCISADYDAGKTSAQVKSTVLGCASNGGIVNLHEYNTSGTRTSSILGSLIDDLRTQGYCFMTVSELAKYRNKTLTPGQQYQNF